MHNKKSNPLLDKSFEFAVKVLVVTDEMASDREYIVSKQLARSGTAIGALSRESQRAESGKDFIHKLNVGLKEADETQYWLDLAKARNYITASQHEELFNLSEELIKLFVSIINTKKRNLLQK